MAAASVQKAAETILLKRMGTPQEVADAVVFLASDAAVLHHGADHQRQWRTVLLMTSGKTLLIVSGGIEAADAAKRAKEMGHTVVVSDRDPEAPGFAFADSCLIADVYGADETAAAAERYNRKIRKIDGVICVAADAPVTAATVAQRLRLPGISVACSANWPATSWR